MLKISMFSLSLLLGDILSYKIQTVSTYKYPIALNKCFMKSNDFENNYSDSKIANLVLKSVRKPILLFTSFIVANVLTGYSFDFAAHGAEFSEDSPALISAISSSTIESTDTKQSSNMETKISTTYDFGAFKLPYNHENIEFKNFLGKATLIFNMKLDDPQTPSQFPTFTEIFEKYKKEGLKIHAFPTEQVYIFFF